MQGNRDSEVPLRWDSANRLPFALLVARGSLGRPPAGEAGAQGAWSLAERVPQKPPPPPPLIVQVREGRRGSASPYPPRALFSDFLFGRTPIPQKQSNKSIIPWSPESK